VSHPLFARLYDRVSPAMEREVGALRDELLGGLTGRVVDVGAGNGAGLAHYPATVSEVVAVEPERYLRERAREAARSAPVPVTVVDGLAAALPLEDASVDAAVCSQVLCTVPSQAMALAELRRVLRPGGQLRFLEHVRAPSRRARTQDLLVRTSIWPRLCGGCHPNRDTAAAVEASGFRIQSARSLNVGPAWLVSNPHLLGRAYTP
jgi:ubiquinone/menaquinone biosynthesis C-methylase UbiE